MAGTPDTLFHPPKRIPQEVQLPFRDLADSCLLFVDRELELAHDLAQLLQRLFGFASPAQDHEVVRVGHDARAKTSPSPSFFHPSTNRRMYRFASNGEMGEPCGMPRRLSRASVVRVFLPRSSVSSTGHSSHILMRCSTRRSTIRRVTDFTSSAWGMLPK